MFLAKNNCPRVLKIFLHTPLEYNQILLESSFQIGFLTSTHIRQHIFPKTQVAANKNAHNFWHHLWAQFFMLFYMVWSILFKVSALKTLKWKFLIGCSRISTNEKVVSWPNTPNKMDHTMQKSMKNCAQKWRQKLCAFFFEVTCAFGKMCNYVILSKSYIIDLVLQNIFFSI